MFVYPFQIVLKTCGTTTLLNAIQPLLALARAECGLTQLNNVFYCRKRFLVLSLTSPHFTHVSDPPSPSPLVGCSLVCYVCAVGW
jgi:hypothetical protein